MSGVHDDLAILRREFGLNYPLQVDAKALAAMERIEAEVARLTNKLNEDSQNFEIECLKAERDRLEYRAEAAEAALAEARENLGDLVALGEATARARAAEAALAECVEELERDPFVRDGWQTNRVERIKGLLSRAHRALAATDTNQTPESGKPVKGKGSSGK